MTNRIECLTLNCDAIASYLAEVTEAAKQTRAATSLQCATAGQA